MKTYQALCLAVVSFALSQAAISQTGVPVLIDPSVGCTANAKVVNVESVLSVRGGPGQQYEVIDELLNDNPVYICDTQHDGWLGVVYPNLAETCDVSAAASGAPQPYQGEIEDCGTGWVSSQFIRQ